MLLFNSFTIFNSIITISPTSSNSSSFKSSSSVHLNSQSSFPFLFFFSLLFEYSHNPKSIEHLFHHYATFDDELLLTLLLLNAILTFLKGLPGPLILFAADFEKLIVNHDAKLVFPSPISIFSIHHSLSPPDHLIY
jgi:hypothetical protein